MPSEEGIEVVIVPVPPPGFFLAPVLLLRPRGEEADDAVVALLAVLWSGPSAASSSPLLARVQPVLSAPDPCQTPCCPPTTWSGMALAVVVLVVASAVPGSSGLFNAVNASLLRSPRWSATSGSILDEEGVLPEVGGPLMSTSSGVPARAMRRSTSAPRSCILAFLSLADFTYTGWNIIFFAGEKHVNNETTGKAGHTTKQLIRQLYVLHQHFREPGQTKTTFLLVFVVKAHPSGLLSLFFDSDLRVSFSLLFVSLLWDGGSCCEINGVHTSTVPARYEKRAVASSNGYTNVNLTARKVTLLVGLTVADQRR